METENVSITSKTSEVIPMAFPKRMENVCELCQTEAHLQCTKCWVTFYCPGGMYLAPPFDRPLQEPHAKHPKSCPVIGLLFRVEQLQRLRLSPLQAVCQALGFGSAALQASQLIPDHDLTEPIQSLLQLVHDLQTNPQPGSDWPTHALSLPLTGNVGYMSNPTYMAPPPRIQQQLKR